MTADERRQKLAAYEEGPRLLAEALKKFPREMWQWKPAPERWSIHEILVHMGDSETNAYLRARRFLADPGLPVMAYDQDLWAQKLNYHAQNPDDAVALITLVRRMTCALVKNLPDSAWATVGHHAEYEPGTYTFDRWLDVYSKHIHGHIAQMQKNYDAWKAR